MEHLHRAIILNVILIYMIILKRIISNLVIISKLKQLL